MKKTFDIKKMEIFYPGKYTAEEQAVLDEIDAGTYEGGPKLGPNQSETIGPIEGWEAQLYARGYDKYNKIWFDSEYAKSNGFKDTPVRPGFVAPEFTFFFPPCFGESALGLDTVDPVGDGYDQDISYLEPIYPGDMLTIRNRKDAYYDATDPGGSIIRKMIAISYGEAFNQDGVKVMELTYRYPYFKCRSTDPDMEIPMEHPFQRYLHPIPKYTEEDWKQIKKLMLSETIREESLYWEDVQVGDDPGYICEGPIMLPDMMRFHALPLLMAGNIRDYYAAGKQGPYGYHPDTGTYENFLAAHITREHGPFYNYTGRNLGIRLVTNWCGGRGRIVKCAWRLVNDAPPEKTVNRFPADYWRPSFLLKVPALVENNRYMNIHGFTYDLGLMKGYVSDKYIDEQGNHMVELVVWGEDKDGNIWTELLYTVRLPSRG